jgi:hypothetical protein
MGRVLEIGAGAEGWTLSLAVRGGRWKRQLGGKTVICLRPKSRHYHADEAGRPGGIGHQVALTEPPVELQ